jgi:hypothetical protein
MVFTTQKGVDGKIYDFSDEYNSGEYSLISSRIISLS